MNDLMLDEEDFGDGGMGLSVEAYLAVSAAFADSDSEAEEAAEEAASETPQALTDLIMSQQFNGSFDVSTATGAIAGLAEAEMGAALEAASVDVSDSTLAMLATALICAVFETRYPGNSKEWSLILKKARKWIRKEAKKAGVEADWETVAAQLLASK